MKCMRRLSWALASVLLISQTAPAQSEPVGLKILVVEGEGAVNDIKKAAGSRLVVEVRDRDDKPVPGAAVVFELPELGPSGSFADGGRVETSMTGAGGRAVAVLRPNKDAGPLRIEVRASYQGRSASAAITQTNVIVSRSGSLGGISRVKLGILVGVAAGAGTAAYLLTRGGGPGAATISLASGAIVVGPPR
jgi:hypothetical protein